MKKLLIIPLIVLLTACAKTSSTESIINATQLQIDNLSSDISTLPKECNTASIIARLNTIKEQVTTINQSCTVEKESLNKDIRFWKWLFFGLAGLLGFLIAWKIFK